MQWPCSWNCVSSMPGAASTNSGNFYFQGWTAEGQPLFSASRILFMFFLMWFTELSKLLYMTALYWANFFWAVLLICQFLFYINQGPSSKTPVHMCGSKVPSIWACLCYLFSVLESCRLQFFSSLVNLRFFLLVHVNWKAHMISVLKNTLQWKFPRIKIDWSLPIWSCNPPNCPIADESHEWTYISSSWPSLVMVITCWREP